MSGRYFAIRYFYKKNKTERGKNESDSRRGRNKNKNEKVEEIAFSSEYLQMTFNMKDG